MSQIRLTKIGELTDSVALVEDPDLTLGDDDVLVAIEAAPVNPVDYIFAAGFYGVPARAGSPLGSEGVGRVEEAGTAVDRSLVGSRVIILATEEQGTWADRAVVPARNVVAVGEEGDAAQLAQLSINPATARVMLTELGDLGGGDWVGQTLGNSGVGQYVAQLARRDGVHTLSIVRSEAAAEQVYAAGGDIAVIQGPDLAARIEDALGGRRLDLVLDGEGGSTVGELARSLKDRGTVAAYSAITGEPQVIGLSDLIFRDLSLRGWWLVEWLRRASRATIEKTYGDLAALVGSGDLKSSVERVYPISEYAEAFTHAARTGRSGKILFGF
jgi:NADPH:quinone reductase-like Zn-dependent oxidoreductase